MKLTSLMRGQLFFDRHALRRAALCSIFCLFAAHAFCFFNLTYSGASVMLNVSSGRAAQITSGHYLQPIYFRLRGSISAPLLVGMLSTLYLTVMNLVLVWLLKLQNPASVFALCGATTINAGILSVCASSLHTADASFLALLLCALACACCMRIRLGALPGIVLLTAALAMDSSTGAFFAAILLLVSISDLILTENAKTFLRDILTLLLVLCASILLHQLGHIFFLHRNHLQSDAIFSLIDITDAYLTPPRAMLSPLTAYAHLSAAIRILLAILTLVLVVHSIRTRSFASSLALILGVLAFPLACGMTFLSTHQELQITSAHALLDVLFIVLLVRLTPHTRANSRFLYAVFTILFTGSIVFSNQVYLKKNLEFESTISLMSRIVSRIEHQVDYRPGHTPVAFIGTPESSVLYTGRKGFDHLDALKAARGNYAITNDTDMIWYMWEVMGYPINFVDSSQLARLRENDIVKEMPAFPQEGCCTFIGDTLVMRLSP